jgi:epoxyqueuosine reductase
MLSLDDDGYRRTFKGSPMKRAKRRGLARNAAYALGNTGDTHAAPALEHAAHEDAEPIVREAAEWSLRRLRERSQATST